MFVAYTVGDKLIRDSSRIVHRGISSGILNYSPMLYLAVHADAEVRSRRRVYEVYAHKININAPALYNIEVSSCTGSYSQDLIEWDYFQNLEPVSTIPNSNYSQYASKIIIPIPPPIT